MADVYVGICYGMWLGRESCIYTKSGSMIVLKGSVRRYHTVIVRYL